MEAVEYRDSPESGLIQECKKGTPAAFDELIRRHQDTVFSLCYRLLGDYDEAADLSQEVFLNCFRKIKSFRGEAKFSSWLYRMTINMAKNVYKHHQRRAFNRTHSIDQPQFRDGEERQSLQIASSNPSPQEIAAGREEMRILAAHMKKLSFDHRKVLILRYLEGLEYKEIGEILNLRIGTVKSRINRARNELKTLMKDILTAW